MTTQKFEIVENLLNHFTVFLSFKKKKFSFQAKKSPLSLYPKSLTILQGIKT